MKTEINVAAGWWADQLKRTTKMATEGVIIFQKALEHELLARFEGHWYEDSPSRGAAYRCIVNDIRLDAALANAAAAAKILDPLACLPSNIMLWVNPGHVYFIEVGGPELPHILYQSAGYAAAASPTTPSTPRNASPPQRNTSPPSATKRRPAPITDDPSSCRTQHTYIPVGVRVQ